MDFITIEYTQIVVCRSTMSTETWFKLENFTCPVSGCRGTSGKYTWICAQDRTSILISQRGNMKCSNYIPHEGKICEWRFDCGNHGNHPTERYKSADLEGFCFAMSQAVQLTTKAGALWVGALLVELEKQYLR